MAKQNIQGTQATHSKKRNKVKLTRAQRIGSVIGISLFALLIVCMLLAGLSLPPQF